MEVVVVLVVVVQLGVLLPAQHLLNCCQHLVVVQGLRLEC
jgi:hypothetical protein